MQEFVNILLTYHPFTLPLMLVFYSSNHPGLFLNLIPGKTSFGVYADIYGVSSTANSLVYSGSLKFHKKILWLINTSTTLTSATLRTEVGMIPIDGMAGGVLDLESYLDDIPAEFQEFVKQPKFCFIPRGSALALNDWDTNYSANLQGQDLFALNKTSFEHTAMPLTVPESHVTFDATKQFVINQLKDNPISPDTFLPSFCGNQTVTVKNPLSRPLSWTVSDNAFTVTSPTNTSAVIGGLTTNYAVLTVSSGNLYPLKRQLVSTCHLSLSGPSTLLGQGTYSIAGFDDLPEGASVAWGTSNGNLALVSSEGGTAVFRGDYYGECSITATVSFNDVNIELTPRSVQVDIDLTPLNNAMITGPDFVCGLTASFMFENLPDSSWVNWDQGAYATDSNSPYTVNISSYSGAPGIAKVTAEITYKGKPQGLTHEYGFSFNSPGTRYVEDSVIMINSTYYDSYRGVASVSLTYLYPAYGITYEWASPDQGWTLVHGGTDYAEFEGPLEASPVTIRMCFTNPCGGRTCLVREVYLPDFSSGGDEPFSMVLSAGGDMLDVELGESLIGRASVPGSYEVQIWSTGSLLRRVTADRRTCQVSLGGLPAGIYFVRVVKDGKTHVRKWIRK